ncbi:MAG: ribose 5-phosphate isomerase B [Candidatus Aegiribacteria sp.]|nr:ribose 5-phosphate isomerase B [Candidatus Aegiribacteria sp.]
MNLVIASDHAGFPLKCDLIPWLVEKLDLTATDLGSSASDSVDYPDYAGYLCRHLLEGKAERGILICNSGIGMSMSANRYPGIRAALCLFPQMAFYARHHNNANVLILAGGITAPFLAREIVDIFLREGFDEGRHSRRTGKIESVSQADFH